MPKPNTKDGSIKQGSPDDVAADLGLIDDKENPRDTSSPLPGEFLDEEDEFFEEPDEADEDAEDADDDEESEEDEDGEDTDDETDEEDPGEESEKEEEEDEQDTNALLLAELQNMRAEIAALKAGKDPNAEPKDPAAAIQTVTAKDIEVSLTDDDFDAMQTDAKSASKIIAREVNKAVKSAVAQAQEAVYQQIPRLVNPVVARNVATYSAAMECRKNNADLVSDPRVLRFMQDESNRLSSENPSWSPEKVYNEAAKSTRSLLKIAQKKKGDTPASSGKKPKPKGGGTKPAPKKKLTGFQKEFMRDIAPFKGN